MPSRTRTETAFEAALRDAGFTGPRGRAEFGLKVGVDGVTVWRWVTGRSKPNSHATRVAVADALGRREDELDALFPDETPEAA